MGKRKVRGFVGSHLTYANVAATLALILAASGGVAAAAGGIPGAGGTVQACYQKETGALRAVSDNTQCKPSEGPLAWNQQGPKGDPGPKAIQARPGPPAPKAMSALPAQPVRREMPDLRVPKAPKVTPGQQASRGSLARPA